MSVYVFFAVLQCIFISYFICRQKSSYELNNLKGDPLEIQHPKFIHKVEVVLRISMILSPILCFKYMHELLSRLTIHFRTSIT